MSRTQIQTKATRRKTIPIVCRAWLALNHAENKMYVINFPKKHTKDVQNIWLSNLLTLSVHDAFYSRNVACALN
jgi:broad specificity polyphosphatase/5'/3'-nucleotidase SurE